MYLQKVLDGNLGFTDRELESYYKSRIDSFKVKSTINVSVPRPKRQMPNHVEGKARRPGANREEGHRHTEDFRK